MALRHFYMHLLIWCRFIYLFISQENTRAMGKSHLIGLNCEAIKSRISWKHTAPESEIWKGEI